MSGIEWAHDEGMVPSVRGALRLRTEPAIPPTIEAIEFGLKGMGDAAVFNQGAFSGHESFPFRHGWLKRGLDAVSADCLALSRPDAMVPLGVGKNMVESMRHWLSVLGLADVREDAVRNCRSLFATPLGEAMFLSPGWDPYLEHDATLWILHHALVTNRENAGTWWWMFHRPDTATFRRDQVLTEIENLVNGNGLKVSRSTLKRDVDCFVRTYLAVARGPVNPEDVYSAPLTGLGLIQTTLDRDEYILTRGSQPSLPNEVFAWSVAQFSAEVTVGRADRSLGLDQLLFGDCSPGRVLRLSEEAIISRLGALARLYPEIWEYDETAGRHLLLQKQNPPPDHFLELYYRSYSGPNRAVA